MVDVDELVELFINLMGIFDLDSCLRVFGLVGGASAGVPRVGSAIRWEPPRY